MKSTRDRTEANARFPTSSSGIGHREAILDQDHQLEGIDRVEPQAVAEDRGIVGNLAGRSIEPEARHQQLLHLGEERVAIHRRSL